MFEIQESQPVGGQLPGYLLGFSFSTERGSVALRLPCATVQEVVLQNHKTHAVQALPAVLYLLEKYQLKPQQCLGLVVDVGPGGFTGLRTACALAQGLAVGWSVPCYMHSSLEIMAYQAVQALGLQGHYLACLDARQNEVYAATYAWQNNVLSVIKAPSAYPVGTVFDSKPLCAVMSQSELLVSVSQQEPFDHFLIDQGPKASALLQLHGLNWQQYEGAAAQFCQPLYVRHQVAKTIEQRQQAGGS
jgi:tRNA threonylcarbamoyladenosine biosynthesis protein TsaB